MKRATENVVRVPRTFLIDHIGRDLPSPEIVRSTKSHYFIRLDDPEMEELLSDARHYADSAATDCEPSLRWAARALLTALGEPWKGNLQPTENLTKSIQR